MSDTEEKTLSDEALMVGVGTGDTRAFETLVRRHRRRILNLVYRSLGGDRSQAEDVAQEVFLRVWRAAGDYKPKAQFTTWIYRIAVNLCLDSVKSAHFRLSFVHPEGGLENPVEKEGSVGENAGTPSPEALLIDAEESGRILAVLQALPANQRLALVLKKFDGLSYDEIGRILGCSVSAVESLLVRAKRTLREKLLFPGS